MTNKKLMDLAMEVATGNLTTTSVGYDEFIGNDFTVVDHAWEPFEHYPENQYVDMIMREYSSTLNALQRVAQETSNLKKV